MTLFFGDRIRLILRVFRDITRFPLRIRVVSEPLPFLMWISFNVVDGSPDDLMTVSSLVAFRIYILSNYGSDYCLSDYRLSDYIGLIL